MTSNNPLLARRLSPLIVLSCLISCLFEGSAAAQAPTNQAPDRQALVRPCPAFSAKSRHGHKEKPKRKGAGDSKDVLPSCLEAKASFLELQEFLQSFVREQKWSIREEKVSEDAWTFFRSLEKDDLLRFADVGPFAGVVVWMEGKAFVKVNTSEAEGGFTRVVVTARFKGYGQKTDRFAPPQDTWELDSSGALEKILISALQSHYQSLR